MIDFGLYLPLIAILLSAGLVAGMLAGLFGIGGGAIYVPVLYHAFEATGVAADVRMHLAIGTSLAIIIPTSLRSLSAHKRKDLVHNELLRGWVFFVPLGTVLGVAIATSISASLLRVVFIVLVLVLAARMLFGRLTFQLGDTLPSKTNRSIAGIVIGLLSSLIGIGGGILNNTYMTLYGRSMHEAIATSAGVGVLVSIPGLLAYMAGGFADPALPPFSVGYVSFLAMAAVAPASMFVAPVGARLAHRLSRRQLEVGFGIFILLVVADFTFGLTG